MAHIQKTLEIIEKTEKWRKISESIKNTKGEFFAKKET